MHNDCTNCELHKTCDRMVQGQGTTPTPVMFVADNPKSGDASTAPLHGSSRPGAEFNHNLQRIRLPRSNTYITYLVKCAPLGTRKIKAGNIEACSGWLDLEVEQANPQIIATLGGHATRYFLGKVDMEKVHGVPFEVDGRIILPIFHPAAGLSDPNAMLRVNADFVTLGEVLRKQRSPRHMNDQFPNPGYLTFDNAEVVKSYLRGADTVAIDTEEDEEGTYCISLSRYAGSAVVIKAEDKEAIEAVGDHLARPDVLTLLHGSLYDLPELAKMELASLGKFGIHPAKVFDTMVIAYLLQSEPQGLKDLAFRHHGMIMSTYQSMVGEATREKAIAYLTFVKTREWPDAKPLIKWEQDKKTGEVIPKVKQPQNIQKKAIRILKDMAKDPEVDPYARWYKIKPEDGRSVVEETYGVMKPGFLVDISWDEAEYYSARDADATIRIFPTLYEILEAKGLVDTFITDMNIIPMVADMMEVGIATEDGYFGKLSTYFESKMTELETDIIQSTGGKFFNLASHPQVAELLFDRLRLKQIKGRSTDDKKVLSRLVDNHPVVQKIRDWRGYHKLKTTYSDQMPKKADGAGRVHTTFRITRTVTGRLSSAKPNLMAVPIRSEDGRRIRGGFVSADDCTLLSGDYSQIELRILAEVSQDKNMLQVFRDGVDLHKKTAADMWGISIDELTSDQRRPAKALNFGIVYGITDAGIHKQLLTEGITTWSLKDCQGFIDMWLRKLYPGVAKYIQDTHTFAKRYGFVRDLWGRIRYVPGVNAADKWIRLEALRQAGNAPIQMGAQGVIKKAMGDLVPVYREVRKQGIMNPLIQIHDDIVWEIQDNIINETIPLIRVVMENSVKLSIPIKVDFKMGKSWGKMKGE